MRLEGIRSFPHEPKPASPESSVPSPQVLRSLRRCIPDSSPLTAPRFLHFPAFLPGLRTNKNLTTTEVPYRAGPAKFFLDAFRVLFRLERRLGEASRGTVVG
ncbi:hypothetical protein WOLCODRAFT_159039 [Wolfiporia cocos MD-104 SS10]|uniref:Uncharacterized protein n=1 Tax=Wolfiporia cocos (strain MD-104) TaxID=742152 RepID=A0A2H3JBB2_WOLCO|nr:hypothetical protein WOLCODRAFT_159039 [Wolfiporia cocos MD-104 SS10]